MGDMTATYGIWKVTHIVTGINGEKTDNRVVTSFIYSSVLLDAYKEDPNTLKIDERVGYKNWKQVYNVNAQ